MKKNLAIILLLILALVFGWLAFVPTTVLKQEFVVNKRHISSKLSDSRDITCTYPQVMQSSYADGKVSHILPKPERNPIVMTYSDFSSEMSKLKYIDATQTISEVSLVKIIDSTEKFIFIEGTGELYMTVHTIYKNTGVSTYTKQVSILGIPTSSMAMGTCINS